MSKKKPSHTISYTKGRGHLVKLYGKKISGGKVSLYLEYYKGYSKVDNSNEEDKNKIKLFRTKETLNLYFKEKPTTEEERNEKNENLALAKSIRTERESVLNHKKEGFVSPNKKKVNFYDFCQHYQDKYDKKDIRMIEGSIRLFFEFIDEKHIKPPQITKNLIEGFKSFLIGKFNGETPSSYFNRFKKILNAAVKEGLFTISPANGVTISKPKGLTKEILLPHEIVKLSKTHCGNPEIKRAFLLSCQTGLRFVDVQSLKYSHIKDGRIEKNQTKTGHKVIIDLNKSAIALIGKPGKKDDYVFKLPTHNGCLSTLGNWVKRAGIDKHITWHCARHSFGTILTMNNTSINTIKNLMGHSDLEHTQKYLHAVDEMRKKAVNQLPEIEI